MPVDTEFHRWLSQGIDRHVRVILATDVERFGDLRDVRILSGRLVHGTAPRGTSTVHLLFLHDAVTQTMGPITFETFDLSIAGRFDCYDDRPVSVVIRIE